MRLDQEARRIVESRREWGYVISDYELEVQKWKNRARLFYLSCTLIFFDRRYVFCSPTASVVICPVRVSLH